MMSDNHAERCAITLGLGSCTCGDGEPTRYVCDICEHPIYDTDSWTGADGETWHQVCIDRWRDEEIETEAESVSVADVDLLERKSSAWDLMLSEMESFGGIEKASAADVADAFYGAAEWLAKNTPARWKGYEA